MLEVIALVIAVYGAAVATIVAVHALRADRVSVFVSHGWEYPVHFAPSDGSYEGLAQRPAELLLFAVNNGRRDVVVSSLTLDIRGLGRVAPAFVEGAFQNGQGQMLSEQEADDSEAQEKANQRLAPGDTMEVRLDTQTLNRFLNQIGRHEGSATPKLRGVLEDTMGKAHSGSWFEIDEADCP